MSSIAENLAVIRNNIASAAEKSGRNHEEITLIAVTKYVGVESVEKVIECGVTAIGENKVQDAKKKKQQISEDATWRMIGHLQTNKVKDAVAIFDAIDSVDSLKLLKEIDKRAGNIAKKIEVLLEVNVSGEVSKFGLTPKKTEELLLEAGSLNWINIKGLMTMAPFVDDEKVIRETFAELRRLKDELGDKNFKNVDLKHLSMGMSADYQIAIEEGATMVRIGSAIF